MTVFVMAVAGGLLAGTTYAATNWLVAKALAPLRRRWDLDA